jgi:hypothetical protein
MIRLIQYLEEKNMRHLKIIPAVAVFVMGILSLVLAFPLHAMAQSQQNIDSLEVDLMPEYDQPSMLIIYHLNLDALTPLPAQLSLHIPAAAGNPFNVAERHEDQKLYSLEYTTAAKGDWLEVNFTATTRQVQFEYYDPRLTRDDIKRSFVYQWNEVYNVKNFVVLVQAPRDAAQVSIVPALGQGENNADGSTIYTASVGSITAGTAFNLNLSYTRPVDTLPATPPGPVASATNQPQAAAAVASPSDWSWTSFWIGILVGLVAAGVAAGIYWWVKMRPAEARGQGRKRHNLHKVGDTSIEADKAANQKEKGVFCHKCGRLSRPDDQFCRNCGTELRRAK